MEQKEDITSNKKWLMDIRKKIIFNLFDEGIRDVDIARILFSTERSNISRFRQATAKEYKTRTV